MIKNTIIFMLLLIIVWLAKDKFSLPHPKVFRSQLSTEKPNASPKINTHKSVTKVIKKHSKRKQSPHQNPKKYNKVDTLSLAQLLHQHKFYDALAYYLEHTTVKHQALLEAYISKLTTANPNLAIEYMLVFLDEVPQSHISDLLIQTYISQKEYAKAIDKLIEFKDNASAISDEKRFSNKLRDTALEYITYLSNEKDYTTLIDFLENMIDYDGEDGFYRFRLAQLYMALDKTQEALPLLDTLQYDEVYAQKAKTYLDTMTIDEEDDGYEYAIALIKHGSHYLVDVTLDGVSFRLMLDTGASYIYIDEQKASFLEVINDNMRLHTAGNDVSAKLCKASTMRVGDIELSDIKVTTAPFVRDDIDGLLGMNFLNRFVFYIDQEKSILYMNTK